MWKKQRQKTNEYDCSNDAKFDAEKLTQLKNMFNKNAYMQQQINTWNSSFQNIQPTENIEPLHNVEPAKSIQHIKNIQLAKNTQYMKNI